jgi:hypothetical protein
VKVTLLILCLGGLLAAALCGSACLWRGLSEVQMSPLGVISMVLGAVLSLSLGAGLKGLGFYSSRNRHDERGGKQDQAGFSSRHHLV